MNQIPAILLSPKGAVIAETTYIKEFIEPERVTNPSKRKEKERVTLTDLSHAEMLLGDEVEKLVIITDKTIYEYSRKESHEV